MRIAKRQRAAVLEETSIRGQAVSEPLTVPRVALRPEEAADALGVSRDFFDASIAPELRVIRRGRLKLYAVRELERWAEESAARVLD